MDSLREIANLVSAFFRKRELDRDLEAELSSHIDMAVEENMRRGMSPEDARRRALVELGGIEPSKELHREARGLPFLDSILQDLRYTLRTLKRDRGFTIIAILILGLGIGANVAVFSVVNTILLRPLPFPKAQQLVWIAPPAAKCGFSCETYSADAYQEFRSWNHSFDDVGGYFAFSTEDNYRLMGRGVPVPATAIYVTRSFFQVLGVRPSLGRLFLPEDARKGSHPVALLANAYWKRQFAADPGIVGRTVDFNGQAVTVVGVLPPSFDFGAVFSPGEKVDLFTPYILDNWRDDGNDLTMIGRLKPGITLPRAQADTNLVVPQLYFNTKYPNTKGFYKANLTPLKQYVTGRLHSSLLLLWCAVGLILLIVCVNLANLLLGRAAARSKEFAMRLALGAGRRRLMRQLLTESLVLAGAGAALGLGIAYAITAYLAHQGSIALPLLSTVRVGGSALAWTVLLAVAAAVLFGLLPGFSISGVNLQEALKDAGQGMSEGRRHDRTRSALVVSEVALASVLLIGAGLLLRSFLRVLDVNLGFQPSQSAAIKVDYNDGGSTEKRSVIFQRILNHIEAIPGVEAAGMVDFLPLGRNRNWGPVGVQGKVYRPGEAPNPLVYVVTPGFFRAMGMRLIAGRDFSWNDGPKGQPVIIINQAIARTLWPQGNAVGKILVTQGNRQSLLVIGVVADVHETSVEGAPGWQDYFPATQKYPDGAELVIRSKLPPDSLAGSVMRTLRQLNPNQPAAAFEPIQQIVDHAVSPRRFFMLLVTSFAAFGLLLASLGIYGVISYSVTRRTHEIGIRMALGATPGEVQLDVIRRTLRLTLAGIAVGLVLCFAVTRLIASLLFGVSPADPVTFAVTVIVLALVALVAGYLPARRASRIDPMTALRAE